MPVGRRTDDAVDQCIGPHALTADPVDEGRAQPPGPRLFEYQLLQALAVVVNQFARQDRHTGQAGVEARPERRRQPRGKALRRADDFALLEGIAGLGHIRDDPAQIGRGRHLDHLRPLFSGDQRPADAGDLAHLVHLSSIDQAPNHDLVLPLPLVEPTGARTRGRLYNHHLPNILPRRVGFVNKEIGERAQELAAAKLQYGFSHQPISSP